MSCSTHGCTLLIVSHLVEHDAQIVPCISREIRMADFGKRAVSRLDLVERGVIVNLEAHGTLWTHRKRNREAHHAHHTLLRSLQLKIWCVCTQKKHSVTSQSAAVVVLHQGQLPYGQRAQS